jgi:dGTPase
MSSYNEFDSARFIAESGKKSNRSEFARDRARVLHSLSFRRLANKTQVLPATLHDFPRSRLTHSLEVAQIAREMGSALGADPDLVETAALTHDLGHPPFGHNGEDALNEVAFEIGGFEGNAQTLRVLTRLETKVEQNGKSFGLNLTRASLDASIKYPWFKQDSRIKFGAYQDDQEIFDWIRMGVVDQKVSFEAQIMDFADDVAYSVHDVEDAIQSSQIEFELLRKKEEQELVASLCISRYLPDATEKELIVALNRILDLPEWPKKFDGSRTALSQVKAATSKLIGRFAGSAQDATQEKFGKASLTRYNADLIVPRQTQTEVAVLKTLAVAYVMQRSAMSAQYAVQQKLLKELVSKLFECAEQELDPLHLDAWVQATSEMERKRAVIDQVADLTDITAVEWHQRLC